VNGEHRAIPRHFSVSLLRDLRMRALRGADFSGDPRCTGRVGHPLGPAGP